MITRLLLQIIHDIIKEEDFDQLVQGVAHNTKWFLDFDRLTLAIAQNSDTYQLYTLFDASAPNTKTLLQKDIPLQSGLGGLVIQSGKTFQFNSSNPYNIQQPIIDEKMEGTERYACVLAIPFTHPSDNSVSGALMLGSNICETYTPEEIETLKLISTHISLALERIQAKKRLTDEILQRKAAEELLIEAKESAEKANRVKSEFLSRMSHELRTPLNAILGFAQVQAPLIDKNSSPKLENSRNYILQAGSHLLSLINDILDMIKNEHHPIKLHTENLILHQIIENSILQVKDRVQEKEIKLHYDPTDLCLTANAEHLQEVLVHLLANAVKYNCKHGTINIKVHKIASGQIELRVEDTGVGIPIKDQETIFEPFTRLKYATDNEIQGTGIGLALTKFFVEQMDGKIGVESLEQGTAFWVRFKQASPS